MEVRDCAACDIDTVHEIYAHHVRTSLGTFEEEPPSVGQMRQRFDAIVAGNFPFVVAETDGRLAGYAYAGPFRPRSGYRFTCESSVYVAPDMQRRGVGRLLMLRVIAHCQGLGQRQMLAVIGDSDNASSTGLHAALGFEHVGTFKNVGFKFARWVDVVLMQRAL
jgi:L-amino acid N-acyltransferase YncA